MRPAALALIAAAGVACSKGGASGEAPAPSASVISIAAAMGECADLAACERECDAGISDRCRRMGVSYEFGKGTDRDEIRATELYTKACSMKSSDGCLAAGRMYEFHHGVAKDDARAVSFYRLSCDLDNPTGCANLAIMLENGRGTDRDATKARELYERACARGAGLACERGKLLRAAMDGG
jgi:uncharacterized protein